jgi:hypothetical protein
MRALLGALFLPAVLAFVACSAPPPDAPDPAVELAPVTARVPSYRFELKARGSEDPFAGAGTFQLPVGSFIKNMTPSLNNRGDVALDFRAFDNLQHIWKNGAIVHDVADTKAVVTETSLDESGNVAFDVMGAETGNGIYVYKAATGQTAFFTSEPLGAESWINPTLLDDGRVGCRPGTGGQRFLGIAEADGFTRLAVETAANPNSPYDYIFSPSFDRRGNAAVKVMLATGGEEIRFFVRGAAPVILAQDKTANPSSPFAKIDNGVALAEDGQIAFIAKTVATGKRAVFKVANGTTTQIATEGEGGIAQIAFFTPAMNAAGNVVFKGEDPQRRNTIWVGDGASLASLITAGDPLPTDKGEALALPETEADPNNRVTFGGGLAMNAKGDIVFSAALAQQTASGTSRLGTGIYVAKPTR